MIVGHAQFNRRIFDGTFHKRGRRSKGKRALLVTLMLTPLVDMFSLLVIFLLQFFAASPEFLIMDDIRLPEATTGVILREIPTVSVSMDEIFVDRESVGKVKDILKHPSKMVDALNASRKNWMEKRPEDGMLGDVNLEAHTEVESTIVSQIMAILAAQHFGSIQLLTFGETG
jgi:biopolymer transport protein ExbD